LGNAHGGGAACAACERQEHVAARRWRLVLAVQWPGGVAPTQERLLEEQAGPGAVLVRRLQQRR